MVATTGPCAAGISRAPGASRSAAPTRAHPDRHRRTRRTALSRVSRVLRSTGQPGARPMAERSRFWFGSRRIGTPMSTVATHHWHVLPDGRVQCDVCPRACRLHEGQRGLCFVRAREGNAIVLTTWGRSSGFCVDPIEKKPLNHFLPGTSVLSFGTAGGNLGCRFCQNWDISKTREWDKLADAASPEQIALAAERLGCRSVAFTYNDPVIFAEYAMDVADACRARGLKAVAVTAGYMNAGPGGGFFRHMDAANVDLKAFTDDFYHRICAGRLGRGVD